MSPIARILDIVPPKGCIVLATEPTVELHREAARRNAGLDGECWILRAHVIDGRRYTLISRCDCWELAELYKDMEIEYIIV